VNFGSVDSPATVAALNKMADNLKAGKSEPIQPADPASLDSVLVAKALAHLVASTPIERRLLWLVRDLVLQSCTDYPKDARPDYDKPTPVFSGFIAVHAEAIALLAEYGLVTDLTDNGGRVVGGNVLTLEESAAVLKTGPFSGAAKKECSTPSEDVAKKECDTPSEEALARGLDAFFRPSPLLKRLREMHK
jgi:hypothetical protein